MPIRNLIYLLVVFISLPIFPYGNSNIFTYQTTDTDSVITQELELTYINEKNWEGLIEVYYKEAIELFGQREFQAALNKYLKIDSISENHKIRNSATIRSIVKRSEISRTAFTQQSSDYAHLLLEEALEQAQQIDDQELIHYIYLYLADTSGLKGEYDKAKEYIDTALEYFLALDKKEYEPYIARLYMINTAYFKVKKRIDKAQESYLMGIAYTREKDNKLELAKLLYNYGNFQGGYLGGCNDAMVSLLEAKSIYDSLNITDTNNYERLNRDLADCYLENNNHQKASEHYRIAYDLKAGLVKKANRELSQRIETQYQTEKKEQEIALLNTEKELVEQQKTNQRNLLLGGIGITSMIGIFLFVEYRNRKRTNEKLRELDRLKSNFFANISHEFRTPLTLIMGPLEQKLSSENISNEDRQDLEMIDHNSRRLLSLVDQLLDLSRLETRRYQIRANQGNLGRLILTQAEAFQFMATKKDLTFDIKVVDLEEAWYDRDVIEKIMANLLSNALKYTRKEGRVSLRAHRKGDKAILLVENTALSLDPKSLEKLFDRFYQADSHTEGVGIGLSLVRELIHASHGTIQIKDVNEGTFQIVAELPISKQAFKAEEIVEEPVQSTITPIQKPAAVANNDNLEEFPEGDDRPIILVAEDNADVRKLLNNNFSKEYKILEAIDGKQGIELALKWVPDLILSDIMMPEVDGLTLCETIKSDERTSHIPVILLTARAGEEDQYKGLSTGADAYVTKPFKIKTLKTRVAHLIASRKALRDRYSQEIILKPKDIAITNLDELFLERVQNVLDNKLTESAFSIQEFSEAVGMSRMQLHRKLKALTGLSASEFIRSQRLKLAASLLQNSDANVSEIGYQVGFNDHSYFTKCFREAYGVSPSAYGKNKSS